MSRNALAVMQNICILTQRTIVRKYLNMVGDMNMVGESPVMTHQSRHHDQSDLFIWSRVLETTLNSTRDQPAGSLETTLSSTRDQPADHIMIANPSRGERQLSRLGR